MIPSALSIIADDVENPWNVRTLLSVSEMFCAGLVLREHAHLGRPELSTLIEECRIPVVEPWDVRGRFSQILALDNVRSAADIYGFKPEVGSELGLVVGNERRGISRELVTQSDVNVQIPMVSRRLNSLNVAAAAAIALYYITKDGIGHSKAVANPEKRRPDVLFLAPTDHIELGSSIRSAGAFGWQRVLVDDRHNVWFGIDRITRSEGRAAARRARNPVRVVPASTEQRYTFDQVNVLMPEPSSTTLSRANLAGGSQQLLVIPDAEGVDMAAIDWERYGRRVSFVTLDTPSQPASPHFRLDASIVLAESVRQIGRSLQRPAGKWSRRKPRYERVLRLRPPDVGEVVYLDELDRY